ncbi:hypothetical protein [uncultured Bacteroides sp.]|uniref:hypothetical protein n=2 Tax=uncultured Bacteroides sp. TaxID=162156 RepID=UPI0025F89B78|nr:hypothetical protein [uncultured Bacteroides sp.]
MKKHLLFVFLGVLACCSCSNSYDLLENDAELAKAAEDYELMTRAAINETDSLKVETIADEQAIQTTVDEYMTQLMNNPAIAKQKVMRTLYNTTCDVVGVFKVGSCGVYKELEINMDAEDTRQDSKKTGNTGDSFVDGNGNIRFKFCLTEASQFYPGGVFLLDHVDYAPSYGGSWNGTMQVVIRYHDCDDKHTKNKVVTCGDSRYDHIDKLSKGFTQINKNAALAWAFPSQFKVPSVCSSYFGPKSLITYGVLSGSANSVTGRIYVDDEDTNNTNWAKLYRNLALTANLPNGDYPEYGLHITGNTYYNITVSTDYNRFVTLNNYYPVNISTCN